jgi:hypothetical protein
VSTQVGIFAVEGTKEQVQLIRRAVSRCRFDFDRLLPRMGKKGYKSIRVVFDGASPLLQGGRFWAFAQTFSRCTITVKPDISPLAMQVVFLHEAGHFVDAFLLNDAKRGQIHKVYHGGKEPGHGWFEPSGSPVSLTPYARECQEGFASDFIDLFSDVESGTYQIVYSHTLPPEDYREVRQIVLRVPEPVPGPTPEPEPIPDPEPTPPPVIDAEKVELTNQLRSAMDRIEKARTALDPEEVGG